MPEEHSGTEQRSPQLGDIVLFGKSTDSKGEVTEVPAIILGVHASSNGEARVDLKTLEMGHEMDSRREVGFSDEPRQGRWRWRPNR
jgi:hypothetical protein